MHNVIDLLYEAGVKKINFAGGEPFLFKEELGALLAQARGLGMYTSVISNGSLITDEWMTAQ
jgi:radical S-adenosyl methionine domain-containing protein 2